jgi:UDP-glucose 4-epimerase
LSFHKVNLLDKPELQKVFSNSDIDAVIHFAAISFANRQKTNKELGWEAILGLEEVCEDTWHWQSKNPEGFIKYFS